jgi:TM2 domain-containing membrane protein YozV
MSHYLRQVWLLYADGFRRMTLGRTLWFIILLKLFILFGVLKLFFFPDYLSLHASSAAGKGSYVGRQLIERSAPAQAEAQPEWPDAPTHR